MVGRHPPAALVQRGRAAGDVTFTGFVEDVRPYVHAAQAFVIPLRVGGGTRIKAFEAITVAAQDFDSVTLHNPGPWSLVLIEKAEVGFPDCGNASDYVTFITGDRSLSAGTDTKVRLPYPERFKKQVTSACGNGNHKRTVSLIVNSGNGPDGKRWDAQAKLVSRKIEGDVAVPAS